MKKLSSVLAALAVMILFTAGTAQAQHRDHRNGDYRNGNHHGDYRGNHGHHGGHRGGGSIVIGRGGVDIDINIGGGRRHYPNGGYNRGCDHRYGNCGHNGGYYSQTMVVIERVAERVYDRYSGRYIYTGHTYSVRHVATYSSYYGGYVWYDVDGQLRVSR